MRKFTKLWKVLMILLVSSSVLVVQAQKNVSTDRVQAKVELKKESKTEITPEQIKLFEEKGLKGEELNKAVASSLTPDQKKILEVNGINPEGMIKDESIYLKAQEILKETDNFVSSPVKPDDGSDAINPYTFSQSVGTYTPITGGTVHASGSTIDDGTFASIPIGFTFTYDGVGYTTVLVSSNGSVVIGASTSPGYIPISGTFVAPGAAGPFGRDLQGIDATSEVRSQTLGIAPNRTYVVQWKNLKRYGTSYVGESMNFQLIFYETTNQIDFIYGAFVGSSYATPVHPQVGLRGANNLDYSNRTTTTNWAATTAGANNIATCTLTNLVFPANGQIFTWTPPAAGTPLPPTNPSPANGASGVAISGNLTWTFGANTVTYDLWFGPTGSMVQVVTGGTAGATGSYAYSGLANSSGYQWQVVEKNGALITNGPVWSFFTVCAAYTLPYTENFDGVTPPVLPLCMSQENTNGDANTWKSYALTTAPSIPNVAQIAYNGTLAMNDWLFTPGFILTAGTSYTVAFKYTNNSSTFIEKMEVKWGDAANSAAMTNGPIFNDAVIQYNNVWKDGSGYFTPSTNGVYYIGFHGYSAANQFYLYLDNVSVTISPACPPPSALTATGITANSANLGWTESGSATAWDIELGAAGFVPSGTPTAPGVTANPYTYGGLSASTSYDFYVRAKCGGSAGDSPWVGPKNFATSCGATVAPWCEHFPTQVIPVCWTMSGPQPWVFTNTWPDYGADLVTDHTAGGGGSFAGVDGSGSAGLLGITLTSPPLDISSMATAQLKFYVFNNNISSTLLADEQEMRLYVITGTSTLAYTWPYGKNNPAWEEVIIPLAGYSSPLQLQFVVDKGTGLPFYDDMIIDDICIEIPPTCPQPAALTVTNLTATSADLGWTETGSATAWEYQYGPAGFVPAATGTATTLNPTPISGLSSSTSYDFYVRANCGSGDFSAWSGPKNFKTPCNAYGIPWSENFDAMTIIGNNILPDCWLATSPSGTPWTSGNAASITYNDPCSSPNYVYVSYSPSLVDKFLITPGFNLTAATSYDFRFNWVGDGLAGWTGDVLVNNAQTGTGATVMGSPFVVAATTTTANCTQATRSFIPPINGIYYFMVRVNNTGVPWYLGFDDFGVELSPACPPPFDLTATGITANSANIGWTSLATAWEYQVGLAGFTPAATGTPTTLNPTPVGGLLASTSYDFYVRANCGSGLYSTWAGPYTFATLCDAATLPYCNSFDAATFPLCWTQGYAPAVTSNRWNVNTTNLAGGTANEMHATWQNVIGESWLQSPELIVPAGGAILTFKHFYDDFGAGLTLGVRYSNNGGATWTPGWSFVSGGGNLGPATINDPITLSGNVSIQWYMVGNHYQLDNWYVDDVCVTVPLAHDAKTVSIDVPGIIQPGNTIPLATVANNGSNVETFNVTMTINPGLYTSTKQVTALNPFTSIQVAFDPWIAAVGNYTVTVCTQLAGDLDPANNCINNQAVSVQVLRKVYCYVAYDPALVLPEGPAWFYVQSPGTITSLAATTSAQFISAGTWADGVWYGSEYYDATLLSGGGWWSISETTGAMTLIADFDKGFAGITFNKNTGIMYGTEWDAVALTNKLYTIDRFTGVSTLLGTFGTSLMINLANDGIDLYAIGISDDQLYKIFPTTPPTAVAIGPTGYAFNYGQDMEYDYDNNIMYVAGYTTAGSLYTANLTTGACTLLGGFQSGSEITGFAIPYVTGHRVLGNVYYGNTGTTKPMATNTTVTLTPGPTVSTGTLGYYEIGSILDGAYKLSGATTKAGTTTQITGADYIIVNRMAAGLGTPYTNLQYRAGDVNKSNTVTASDAILIKRRAAGLSSAWAAPVYVFDGPFPATPVLDGLPVTVSGSDVTQDLRTLLSGDMNGSFTPPAE